MAVRETANLPGRLTSADKVPSRTRAVLRCLEEKFGDSSKGNKMITREWEVVVPEVIEINGSNKVLAGQKIKQYRVTITNKENGERDDTKSDSALAQLRDELKALGLPYETIDDENPELLCTGMYADANLGSDEYEIRNPATPEEKALGKKYGTVKLGEDGKPEKGYRLKLEAILGKATPVAGQTW